MNVNEKVFATGWSNSCFDLLTANRGNRISDAYTNEASEPAVMASAFVTVK